MYYIENFGWDRFSRTRGADFGRNFVQLGINDRPNFNGRPLTAWIPTSGCYGDPIFFASSVKSFFSPWDNHQQVGLSLLVDNDDDDGGGDQEQFWDRDGYRDDDSSAIRWCRWWKLLFVWKGVRSSARGLPPGAVSSNLITESTGTIVVMVLMMNVMMIVSAIVEKL